MRVKVWPAQKELVQGDVVRNARRNPVVGTDLSVAVGTGNCGPAAVEGRGNGGDVSVAVGMQSCVSGSVASACE